MHASSQTSTKSASMSEWPLTRLDELYEVRGRIGWKGYKTSDLRESGPLVIGGKEVKSEIQLNLSNVKHLTREKFDESPEIILAHHDLLVVCRGNLADVGLFDISLGEATLNPSVVLLRTRSTGCLPKFAFYFFSSRIGRNELLSIASGSSVPAIYQSELKKVSLPNPPLLTQKAIAEVLSSLDDKIDLLKRQNKTLEGMAEALFRQWFIEEAQDDWEYSELGNFVDIANGLSYKSSDLKESSSAMISLKCFRREGGFSRKGLKEFDGVYKERHVARTGDLFIACTDLTQDAEVVGNPIVLNDNFGYSLLVFSMDTVKVIPTGVLGTQFLYHLMQTRLFKGHCKAYANGSTVLHLQKSAIPEFEFFIPPIQKSDAFESKCEQFNKRIVLNELQIESLERQRETLLPKLMSGEVRVQMD